MRRYNCSAGCFRAMIWNMSKVKYVTRGKVAFEELKGAYIISRRVNYEDREWKTVSYELRVNEIS